MPATTRTWSSNDAGCRVHFSEEPNVEQLLREVGAPESVFVICTPSARSLALVEELVGPIRGSYEVVVIGKALSHVPEAVVEETVALLPRDSLSSPFALLSIGGGAAIGLAKALSLRYDRGLPIYCIPTTYSGSEMTNIVGITTSSGKTSRRDSRVRPALVIYNPTLLQSMTKNIAITSSFNALAHAVEALWDSSASPTSLLIAESGAKAVVRGLLLIARDGMSHDSLEVCRELLYGAYLCGSVLNSNTMGLHHKLAHLLGGSYNLPHSETHTVLLPHTVNCMVELTELDESLNGLAGAFGTDAQSLAMKLFDLLKCLGAPTNLRTLGLTYDDVSEAADRATSLLLQNKNYSLPANLNRDSLFKLISSAFHARRPNHRVCFEKLPLEECGVHANIDVSIAGCPLSAESEVCIVCIHGRFASADIVIKQLEDIIGIQAASSKVSIVAPQARASSWYNGSFLLPWADNQPGIDDTITAIDCCVHSAMKYVPPSRIILFGFSQGACSVLTYMAGEKAPCGLGGVIALSGGLCGTENEVNDPNRYPCCALEGISVILGCAEEDNHVPIERVLRTKGAFEKVGKADVICDIYPGSDHKIFDTSASKARCLFNALKAKSTSSQRLRDPFSYLSGYMSLLESQALPDTIPRLQRSPRHVPYGLVAEVINGSPFCAPRSSNLSTWFYRIHPSVGTHGKFQPYHQPRKTLRGDFCCPGNSFTPEPVRWNQPPDPAESSFKRDFVDGIVTIAGTGNPMSIKGMAIHTYSCNLDMVDRAFYDADGDMLIVPEKGDLHIQTEFGYAYVSTGEIFILPRGLKMTVSLPQGSSRGFISELFEVGHFQLPNLGPIGSNGLADPRHFQVPTAAYEDRACENYQLISKFGGELFMARLQYSPYDVVGWSGRYHPAKYNLLQFMAFGSVTWDHADPSLHTVLSCPIDAATGASACDIVCFRSRFDAVQHTFRPPWYHRNAATEFNAIIEISNPYSGFDKGVHWLTPTMSGHGIAGASYNGFSNAPVSDEATRISEDSIWIMFESIYPMILTEHGANAPHRDLEYRHFFSVRNIINISLISKCSFYLRCVFREYHDRSLVQEKVKRPNDFWTICSAFRRIMPCNV